MRNLTNKQEKFVQGLLKGLSQREAYKQAYNTSKMKDKSIDEKACVLLNANVKVKARFEELRGKVIKKSEEKAILSAIEVLELYSRIAKGEEKDVVVSTDFEGNISENRVFPTLKERIKALDALAKRYGLDKKSEEKENIVQEIAKNIDNLTKILSENTKERKLEDYE